MHGLRHSFWPYEQRGLGRLLLPETCPFGQLFC
jgi:hypothetical protein